MKKIIVIIGAGPAGITAGYELLKQSDEYKVIILEQSDSIGGISKTVKYHGNRMDMGGHRFFSKEQRVMDWWQNIMPLQGNPSYDDKVLERKVQLADGGPDPEKEDRVMLVRNRVSRIYYKNKFFDYPVKMNWNTIKNMGALTTLSAGASFGKTIFYKRNETSLENFYINRFGKKLYSMFFEAYTEKLWGRHPRNISADWGAQRVKGLSVTAILKDNLCKMIPMKEKEVETSLIEEYEYPKYGPGQLWETAAEDFIKMGGIIKKNCCVNKIELTDHKVSKIWYTENKESYSQDVDAVFSSMPLKNFVEGINDVEPNILHIAEGLPYRDFVTVGILLNEMNLTNHTKFATINNIVPDCWIYVQDPGIKMGRIQVFNNWSPYMVKDPQNTIWMGLEYFCDSGDAYWNMTKEEWGSFALQELKKMNIVSQNTEVLDYHCEKVEKAYPAYFDTYKDIDQLIEWLNQISNLYCIGRNGQHRYNNMDHSMMTAFEAVNNLVHGRQDKCNIWNVNTEKSYHEER